MVGPNNLKVGGTEGIVFELISMMWSSIALHHSYTPNCTFDTITEDTISNLFYVVQERASFSISVHV